MPSNSKVSPTVRGSDKAKTGRESVRKAPPSNVYPRTSKVIPKWTVTDYTPPRKITDKELEAARKMFFELDRDGSGSIDADELGMMLRSLGQNPTEEELKELIDSVDDGDKDGQIQLREFLMLYTQGLDSKTKGKAGKDDVNNVYIALGGSQEGDTAVDKSAVSQYMLDHFDLAMDPDVIAKGDALTKADFENFLAGPNAK